MEEVTEKYYRANDGTKFKDEDKCKKYEEDIERIRELRNVYNKKIPLIDACCNNCEYLEERPCYNYYCMLGINRLPFYERKNFEGKFLGNNSVKLANRGCIDWESKYN